MNLYMVKIVQMGQGDVLLRYTLAGAAQAVVRREHRERGERKRWSDGRCARGARTGPRRPTMMLMGYTWADTARPMARLVEQEDVHGIGTAGEHAKRHVHGNEDQGQTKYRYSPPAV